MKDQSTRHTFNHLFRDGNYCSVTIDFDDEPKAEAKWKSDPNWKLIEVEYKQWREFIWQEYYKMVSPEVLLKASIKSIGNKKDR